MEQKELIQGLIDEAKNKYPVSVHYTGQLTEDEIDALEEMCDVKCSAVYMSGAATYVIRYKRQTDK